MLEPSTRATRHKPGSMPDQQIGPLPVPRGRGHGAHLTTRLRSHRGVWLVSGSMPRDELLTPPQVGPLVRTGEFQVRSRHFLIETNSDDLARSVEGRFADLAARDTVRVGTATVYSVIRHDVADSHPWGVWRDGEPCETTITPGYVVPYILWELTRLLLESTPPGVPIHAAAATRARQGTRAGRAHPCRQEHVGRLAHPSRLGFSHRRGGRSRPRARPPVGAAVLAPRRGTARRSARPARRPNAGADRVAACRPRRSALSGSEAPLAAFVMPHYSPGNAGDLTPLSPAATLAELTRHLPTLRRGGRAVLPVARPRRRGGPGVLAARRRPGRGRG